MNKKRWIGIGAAVVLGAVTCTGLWLGGNNTTAIASEYGDALEESGKGTIEVQEDTKLEESLVVNGDKTITGEGTLEVSGDIVVKSGSTLTIESAVEVDATNKDYGIHVEQGAKVVVKDIHIKAPKKHGIYNQGTLEGTNITISSAGDLGIYNAGEMEINGLTVEGTMSKAVYNNKTAKISNATIEGASATHDYLVDNNGGTLELTNVTVKNAKKVAVYNRGGANTVVSNVTVDTAAGNAVLVDDASSSIKGSGFTIKNAKDNAIYNKGTLEIRNLTINDSKRGVYCRYNGWATLSGTVSMTNIVDAPIRIDGPESGNYNNGVILASGTQMTVDTAGGHGVNNKGSFLAAADSSLTVKNITGSKVNGINNNGGIMTLGDVVVDNVHVTIDTYTDASDGNAVKINTNSGNGIMNNGTLTIDGKVQISNLYVTPENGLTDNSNCSGVVVKNGGTIEGKGSITVTGPETIDTSASEKTLYNGVYVEDTKFALAGEVSVSGASNQGIMMSDKNAKMNVGALTVKNSGGNGIYINHTNGVLNVSKTITVDGAKTNGINNNGGAAITAHDIIVKNITGNGGIANGTGGTIEVKRHITVENVSRTTSDKGQGNGINIGSGRIEAGGNVTVTGITTSGNTDDTSNNGIMSKGLLYVEGDVFVDGVAAGNGIYLNTTGTIQSNGNVTVKNVTAKRGIYLKDGNATSKQICNLTAVNVTLENIGSNGIEIANNTGNTFVAKGTVKLTNINNRGFSNQGGVVSVKNIEISGINKNYNGIENKGSFHVTGSYVKVENITSGGNGIYNEGTFRTTASCTTTISSINGAKSNGIHVAKGSVKLGNVVINGVTATSTSDTKAGNGIYNLGTLQLDGTVTINNVKAGKSDNRNNAGIVCDGASAKITGKGSITVGSATDANDTYNHGIFVTNGSLKVKGDISVYHTNAYGIYVADGSAAVEANNITVMNTTKNGLYVRHAGNTLVASGNITVALSNEHGICTGGTVEAKTGTIIVNGTVKNGIQMDSSAKKVEASTIIIKDAGAHAMTFAGANKLDVTNLIINGTGTGNGLWISPVNSSQDIKITNLVIDTCRQNGVAAKSEITKTNLYIENMWYKNCGTQNPSYYTHKSASVADECIGSATEVEALTELPADLQAIIGAALGQ